MFWGKTRENLRKIINVTLVNNAEDYRKYVSKPSFVPQKIFSKNLVAIHEIKPVLTLNKPVYVGFSILDLSKLLMYEFHDKFIKSKYDAKLLFTETDISKQKMFMKIFIRTKIRLILVIMHSI